MEEKIKQVLERKASHVQARHDKIKEEIQRAHSNAEQKRSNNLVSKQKKLRAHNQKVREVKEKVDSNEQKNIESMKEKIVEKLNQAETLRNNNLEKVKQVAQLSAKKKKHSKPMEGGEDIKE